MTRTCVCSRCGSDKILIDAWGYWDAAKQQWALCDLLDDAYCGVCQSDTKIEPVELGDQPLPG